MLPVDFSRSIIFYTNPSPAPKGGTAIGAAGPATAQNMDVYLNEMMELGVVATIGKGERSKDAYEAIIKEYGKEKARIILSAVQMMIAGNMFGIPFSAYQSRRKGKPFKDSHIGYELGMLVGGVLVLPIALLHALLLWIIGKPNIRFAKT